jgi:uncharacterized membrane protein
MEQLFGLPAHPMMVHAPVVLVPLLTLACVTVAVRPGWRARLSPWLVAASVVSFVATMLAMKSGEKFDKLLQGQVDISKHESLAGTTRLFVLVLLVVLVAAAVVDRRRPADGAEPAANVSLALSWVAVVVAVLATVWMVRTGHEGARLVWSGVVTD